MTDLIPTNIITGFLGVGKTTAIRHLLQHKPANERWSVLVNEFGDIGIDGALLQESGAVVREVPGGCICCVGGLPMKMALNMLIAKTRPDRLLIEPTGLGHPAEIIASLTGDYYDRLLDLRATLTLVDPRKLSDSRYTEHSIFQDQLAVADVLVANKQDLCGPEDWVRWQALVASFQPPKSASYAVTQGALELAWLDLPRVVKSDVPPVPDSPNPLSPRTNLYNPSISLPEGETFVRRQRQQDGVYTGGWLFAPQYRFHFNSLFGWLSGLACWRAKAVMNTTEGVYMFNAEQGVLSVNALGVDPADLQDSRLELIDDKPLALDTYEDELLSMRLPPQI